MSDWLGILRDVGRAMLTEQPRRVTDAEIASETLVVENTQLRDECKRLTTRVDNLEAALDRVLNLFSKQWIGPEEGAIMRACQAVLDHK